MKKFDIYDLMEKIEIIFNAVKKKCKRTVRKAVKLYKKNISANNGTPLFITGCVGVIIFAVVAVYDGSSAAGDYEEANYNLAADMGVSLSPDALYDMMSGINGYEEDTGDTGEMAAVKSGEISTEDDRQENAGGEKTEEAGQAETVQEETVSETEPETESPYANVAVTSLKIEDDYVNVRSEPSTNGEIIGKIYNECAAKILESVDGEDGTWYYMKSGNVTGYIKSEFFITGEEAEAKALEIGKMFGRVNAGGLRLREAPDLQSSVITSLWEGEIYTVLEGDSDGFTKITLGKDDDGNEVEGFVKSEYIDTYVDFDTAISKEEEEAAIEEARRLKEEAERLEAEAKAKAAAEAQSTKRSAIVAYAKQFIGNPYVYGGTSLTNGTDCSGFVKSVYAHFGISLTRTSASQANCGTRIPVSDLKAGDLVFYSNGSRIYHVAMYIGGGQIIHAIDESRGIGITSMYFATPYCAVTFF